MNTKYVYWVMLFIVIIAWFSPVSVPSWIHAEKNKSAVSSTKPVHIVANPLPLGVLPNKGVAGGNCNIETINGKVMGNVVYAISKNSQLKLAGWAMDGAKTRLPESTVIRFTSSQNTNYYALARSGLVRDDVRRYFDLTDRVKRSGFELIADISELPVGKYGLTAVLSFTDTVLVCGNGRKIDVR